MFSFSSRKPSFRFNFLASAFLTITPLVTLTNCASNDSKEFAPLEYDYLNPINFNIAQITIQNPALTPTEPNDIANRSPTPPAVALQNMAQNRLKAMGSSGYAVFTIDRATIEDQADSELVGRMEAHMDIYNASNQKTGSIRAAIKHEMQPNKSKGDVDSKANLYTMTQFMMQDMNVELEFQIRKHLSAYLVDATGTPISGAIQTQDLSSPTKSNDVNASLPKSATPSSTPAASDEDLSAIFPTGDGNNEAATSSKTKSMTNNSASEQKSLPTGTLGTLPVSATPSGY